MKIERGRAIGFKKLILKMSKYSTNLYENPSVSFALMNPEKINNAPVPMWIILKRISKMVLTIFITQLQLIHENGIIS